MKILTEKRAESFLKENGFLIAEGFFVKRKEELKSKKFSLLFVAKASGEKIIHKRRINGIIFGIDSFEKAEDAFVKLKKIKGCEEVFFQKYTKGIEFFLGLKQTSDFGQIFVFGEGGSEVENKENFSFRVFPLNEEEIDELLKTSFVSKKLDSEKKLLLKKEIIRFCKMVEKYPNLSELDINPLTFNKKFYVIDARIILN